LPVVYGRETWSVLSDEEHKPNIYAYMSNVSQT